MTNQNTIEDKIQEIIEEMNDELGATALNNQWEKGYYAALETFKECLEALLPKHRILADMTDEEMDAR